MTEEERLERHKISQRKYSASDKGKAKQAKYNQSKKGKARGMRYGKTQKGIERRLRYEETVNAERIRFRYRENHREEIAGWESNRKFRKKYPNDHIKNRKVAFAITIVGRTKKKNYTVPI